MYNYDMAAPFKSWMQKQLAIGNLWKDITWMVGNKNNWCGVASIWRDKEQDITKTISYILCLNKE